MSHTQRAPALTLNEVADLLQVDVRMIRRLLKRQRDEDEAAAASGRAARIVGLRGIYISVRMTRVSEAALDAYLEAAPLGVNGRRRRAVRSSGAPPQT